MNLPRIPGRGIAVMVWRELVEPILTDPIRRKRLADAKIRFYEELDNARPGGVHLTHEHEAQAESVRGVEA